MPKLTLLTATRRLGGRVKAESLRRFTRVTFPAHWQRGAPHPACCHQGMCPVSCCALWLEAAVSLRMRPWCAACGASHRHSSQPLRPQLLILVTSALSEWLCGVPGWGVWDLVLPMSDRGVRLGLQEGTRALPLAGCPAGAGPRPRAEAGVQAPWVAGESRQACRQAASAVRAAVRGRIWDMEHLSALQRTVQEALLWWCHQGASISLSRVAQLKPKAELPLAKHVKFV